MMVTMAILCVLCNFIFFLLDEFCVNNMSANKRYTDYQMGDHAIIFFNF